jgi:uncharacterized membrane protein HdeD (DUF308 family)
VFLFFPGLTMQTVMVIIGTMLLLNGVINMLLSNVRRSSSQSGSFSTQGLFSILFGLVFIASPDAMIKIFVTLLGIFLALMGLLQLMGALRTLSTKVWSWIYFLMALLTLISGVFLIMNTIKTYEAILIFIGAVLVLNGLSELFMAWKISRQPQYHKGSPVQDVPFEEI